MVKYIFLNKRISTRPYFFPVYYLCNRISTKNNKILIKNKNIVSNLIKPELKKKLIKN